MISATRGRPGATQARPTTAQVRRLSRLLDDLDRVLRADFKRARGMPHNLSQAQYDVLALLVAAEQHTCSQAALVARLAVTSPTVVRIVDALEQKDLAQRHRERPDRRLVQVTLTDKGAQAHREAVARHEKHLGRMLDRLSPAQQETLLHSLAALRSVMDATASGSRTRSRSR